MNRRISARLIGLTFITSAMFVFGCRESLQSTSMSKSSKPLLGGRTYTNSIGMKFARIEPGGFSMGSLNSPAAAGLNEPLSYPTMDSLKQLYPQGDPDKFFITTEHVNDGDLDEKPVHRVSISKSFYMGITEVTNAQYEKFDPSHKKLRGKNGFSITDDEAVVYVSWHDAKSFCKWLSKKEGLPYRLATEAEWEYACRAGTRSLFWTGEILPKEFHKNQKRTTFDAETDKVSLTVGKTPANPWGLYDMHGNVEEWCEDWYGPYNSDDQVDPVGCEDGDFKVTRGGSHGTNLYYLRSANRLGTLPENRQWLVGLRVVIGQMSKTKPIPISKELPLNQRNVTQKIPADITKGPDKDKPFFEGPRKYVKIPEGNRGPLYSHHNHDAGITQCANGDLLAIWYTCVEERGRELAIAASRLRYGQSEWEPASPLWDAPDRNDHCPGIWFDGKDTLYHFNGLNVAGMWSPLAIIMRTSKDNGATWSKARLIAPDHGFRNMVGEPAFRTQSGAIVFGADVSKPFGVLKSWPRYRASTVWVSYDEGKTWADPGGDIHGIHAGIVELTDGRLMALGRDWNADGWMPMSISSDMGKTWNASPSPFPPISGGQRLVLTRLKEGPLFFASFAADIHNPQPVPDGTRPPRYKSKIFGALSYDEGKTWPVRRIISDSPTDRMVETIDKAPVLMNPSNSEPLAYLAVCQSANGVINLISSINHYAFNIAWLKEDVPPQPVVTAEAKQLPVRNKLPNVYDASVRPENAAEPWHTVFKQGMDEQDLTLLDGGFVELSAISAVADIQKLSNERAGKFYYGDSHKGLSAEVRVKVAQSTDDKGFEFAVNARGGILTLNQYRVSITKTGIYYWYDKKFVKIAEGLDNYSDFHTYRLAIRDDTVLQIYRDGQLLGLGLVDLLIDWEPPSRGNFIQWGLNDIDAKAIIDHISYDITGPSQPR